MPRKKASQEASSTSESGNDSVRKEGNPNTTNDEEDWGLYLIGEVSDRVKKSITTHGIDVEVVTYTISGNDGQRYYVDDFDPEKYFAIREKVSIPVYVKAYKKKNGEASYMLKLQKKDMFVASRGERF